MENFNDAVDIRFLNDHYNNNYNWEYADNSKDTNTSRRVFRGENKQNNDDCLWVKQFKLKFTDVNNINNDISNFLKETYFLAILKNVKYFVQLEDIFWDKDYKKVFLVFKGNCASLKKLINCKTNDYLSDYDLIKYIIYQISYGLYILHSNQIIHNDIKPSNILIDEIGGITICDFGSGPIKMRNLIHIPNIIPPLNF